MSRNKKKMRILHVITGLGVGGAERALYNLLANGLQEDIENAVVSLTNEGVYGPQLRAIGVPVYSLALSASPLSVLGLFKLWRIVRDFSPMAIQGWMYHANILASAAAFFHRKKTPVSWNIRHSLYDIRREKRLTRWFIVAHRLLSAQVGAIVYNSAVSRSQHESFGISPTKGVVIPNGFDLQRWQPDGVVKTIVRRELSIPHDSLLIGHIARFHPMKDHHTYLEALQPVLAQHERAYALFVGRGVDADNPHLAALFARLPADRLRILGERSDVERLMPAVDIFCLSSWSEAFPNVLGEAMACCVPCVTTDVGDTSEIVGNTGAVVPPADATALSNALLLVLALADKERIKQGQAARARICDHYDMEVMVRRYRNLYYAMICRCADRTFLHSGRH